MSNDVVDRFGLLHPPRRSRAAFTLLELLIVIAIIILLFSILIPVVSRARESGRRTVCISNLESIAHAIQQYVNDNDGALPFAAALTYTVGSGPPGHQTGDWVYWESTPDPNGNGKLVIDEINLGGIGKYFSCNDQSLGGLTSLRCPSDTRLGNAGFLDYAPGQTNPPKPYPPGYPFSYVLNALMSSGNTTGPGAQFLARTLAKVKDPGTKILVFEEDPRTIDDGDGLLIPTAGGTQTDLIAIRHDGIEIDNPNDRNNPQDPMNIINFSPTTLQVPNPGKTGNVAFCDGHVDMIQRSLAHTKEYWAPDPAQFPNYP